MHSGANVEPLRDCERVPRQDSRGKADFLTIRASPTIFVPTAQEVAKSVGRAGADRRLEDAPYGVLEHAGELVSNKALLARAWPDTFVEEANLRVQIMALRKSLGDGQGGARYIKNVPGRGYCFVAPVVGHGQPAPWEPVPVAEE
jgi:DNA-binding response OmpR family regulator